jgi:hypothetical protein
MCVRSRATRGGAIEKNVIFEAFGPKAGLDAEELQVRYGDLFDEALDEPFRANNLILRGRGDGVDYVGKNFTHALSGIGRAFERSHTDHSRAMIGLLKKAPSGKDGDYVMELIPVAGGRVIDLEARLHKYNYTEHTESEFADVENPEVRAKINAKQLEAFASDKRKRQVNRMNAARKLDHESIASPQTMEAHITAGAVNLKSRKDLVVEAGKNRNIPPHNDDATEADLAYPVEATPCYPIFSKLYWKELLEAAKNGTLADEEGKYESLTIELAQNSLHGGMASALNEKAKLIAYCDALCKLLTRDRVKESKPKVGEDGMTEEKPKYPFMYTSSDKVNPDLQRAIIEEYLDEDIAGHVRQFVASKHRKDLIRMQVILIALRVSGWTLKLGAVQNQLLIETKELLSYTKQLGCKSVSGGKNPTVELDLKGKPLVMYLPEIRARAKRAKARE